MLTNVWNKITMYCLNHEEPKKMSLISNTEFIKTPFFACENYLAEKDQKCPNRMNTDDYQKAVLQFLDIMSQNPFNDFSNYTFKAKKTHQSLTVKVLLFSDEEIRLGFLNNTVLGTK